MTEPVNSEVVMSQSKAKARRRCIDLIRDIAMYERNGEYGHKVWLRAQAALGRSIDAYRTLGATNADVISVCLQDWGESDHG